MNGITGNGELKDSSVDSVGVIQRREIYLVVHQLPDLLILHPAICAGEVQPFK